MSITPGALSLPSTMGERPLRILFLAPQPFFEVRGTPLAVLHLTRALAGLGHAVDLLTFPQGEAVATPGVRHLRSLRLPAPVDGSRVTATFKNGLLTVTLPKAPGVKATPIPVKAE